MAEAFPPRDAPANGKLYVGKLPKNIEKRDLEDLFGKYGKVSLELKPGGFAFVEYDDARDAEDAIQALNNYPFEGERISVEWSRRSGNSGSSTCFLCGNPGHWARECPDSRERGLDVRSGKCFKCGRPGHLARFCRDDDGPRDRSRSPQRYDRRGPPPYRRPPPRFDDYPPRRRYEDDYPPRRDYYDGPPPPRDYGRPPYDDMYPPYPSRGPPPSRYDDYPPSRPDIRERDPYYRGPPEYPPARDPAPRDYDAYPPPSSSMPPKDDR